MPLDALGLSSGDPEDANSTEWLRPLGGPSPWGFRPLLATGIAVYLALFHIILYFTPLMPQLQKRFEEFVPEHNRRCAKAEMAVLSF
jgi:hypothetical protein